MASSNAMRSTIISIFHSDLMTPGPRIDVLEGVLVLHTMPVQEKFGMK